MPLYRPSELTAFLEKEGLHAKKALSQNFLIDGNLVRRILEDANVQEGDVVLEIGPGPGVLTEALLEKKVDLYAIEKDHKFAKLLPRLTENKEGRLTVYEEDALKFDIAAFEERIKPKKAKLIANLPYNITTPILTHYVKAKDCFEKLVVMVQAEVADRITSKPSTKEYGSITVFLNFFSTPSFCFKVKKQSFIPSPSVDSAVIKLDLKTPPLSSAEEQEMFFQIVRGGFSQRRKMLRTSLKSLFPLVDWNEALISIGINELSRPENLSLQDFLNLYQAVKKEFFLP